MTTKRIVMSIFVMVLAIVGTIAINNTAKAVTSVPNITRDMTIGTTGDDVKNLQKFLNANGYAVASTGAGSTGNETTMFGNATKAALARFQVANGLTPTGNLGAETRAILIKLLGNQTTTATTNTNTATTVTTDYSAKITALTNEINTLKSQITTLQSQVKTLQTQVNNLNNNDDEDDDEEDETILKISSIKIDDSGEESGIDEGDKIVINFNEAINPESINKNLDEGDYVEVDSDETGGITINSSGVLTIKNIASFSVGDVNDSTEFETKVALNSTGKILTVTLLSGDQLDIDEEDFGDATQIRGTVEDEDGNEMTKVDVKDPTGTFGEGDDEDEDNTPSISSIKVYDEGDEDGIDEGDIIIITFDQELDPTSINSDLKKDSYVDVDSDETGGITVNSSGVLTIKNIASFSVGDVENSTEFETEVALNSSGKVLTITLTNGDQTYIDDEDFSDAEQIGGTIIGEEDEIEMEDGDISDPTGTFGA